LYRVDFKKKSSGDFHLIFYQEIGLNPL